ncbi:alpha/beta hydrolase [Spongiimicrobium sp. 3-5]|uniref:alpha/beta hydrolase n=1 Tax=Spongiimicrobium sp. 3-5 TaxID=3332596 RepID=UPI00397EAF3F
MKNKAFKIQFEGKQIFGKFIQPQVIKGVVLLVHGFGEHSGRYDNNIVPMLLQSSLAVVSYDNIGHGKSDGKRGHCPSYEALLDILDILIVKTETIFPDTTLFLYGHSMGGNLVLNHALRRTANYKGIVATSPYLRLAFKPPLWKMVLGKAMLKLMPSFTLPSGLDPTTISRIPEETESYKTDPLVHDKVSPMFSFPIMDAGEWAIANAHNLQTKTLLLHGTGDRLIDHRATVSFHKKASTTTLQLFEGGYHELHNDLCKEAMMKTVESWLQQQH